MNKNNNLPDSIPDTIKTFQIDLVGSVTKKRFLGEFTCKIPTMKDQSLIAKHEAMLNGEFPVYLNNGVLKLHKWISYLKYTLTDIPKFWRDSDLGFELRDPNVVEGVYNEVLKFEEDWYKQIWGDPEVQQEEIEDGPAEEKEKA